MTLWHTDNELFTLDRRELFSAVVGDVMDRLGLQCRFLPPIIKPLRNDMVVIGRAMLVLEADVPGEKIENGANPLMAKPIGLMSTRATKLGAAGAVLNGYSRDTREILQLDFPTFSYGAYAQDQGPRGKVIDFRVPTAIDGVRIAPGDIIYGDLDGVCVIPQRAETEVFQAALEKVRGENWSGKPSNLG
jgi:hypothetical protein